MSNEHGVFVTLGASNHSLDSRETEDYYATDPIALELLLEKEKFNNNIWECACGEGHLSEVLKRHGYSVVSTDLIDRGYGIGGIDFLAIEEPFYGDIITNPPYKYAREFVEHAVDLIQDGFRAAMFLRLQFLEGQARRELFDKYPPKLIYISSKRINCCKNGDFSEDRRNNSSAVAYAWFIWEKTFQGDPTIRWFN